MKLFSHMFTVSSISKVAPGKDKEMASGAYIHSVMYNAPRSQPLIHNQNSQTFLWFLPNASYALVHFIDSMSSPLNVLWLSHYTFEAISKRGLCQSFISHAKKFAFSSYGMPLNNTSGIANLFLLSCKMHNYSFLFREIKTRLICPMHTLINSSLQTSFSNFRNRDDSISTGIVFISLFMEAMKQVAINMMPCGIHSTCGNSVEYSLTSLIFNFLLQKLLNKLLYCIPWRPIFWKCLFETKSPSSIKGFL